MTSGFLRCRDEIIVLMGLIVMVLLTYSQVTGFSVVKVDEIIFFDAAEKYLFHDGAASLWFFPPPYSAYWPPVAIAYVMTIIKLAGLNYYAVHHLANLCLHIACVSALFITLRLITRHLWPSALTAALFAVHPRNVEAVVSLHYCIYTLSTLFCLIALIVYITKKPGPKKYIMIFFCWTAGLLSHPSIIHLPILFILTDFWMQEVQSVRQETPTNRRQKSEWRQKLSSKLPFFIFALIWLSGSLTYGYFTRPPDTILNPISYFKNLPLGAIAYSAYLKMLLWPFAGPPGEQANDLFAGSQSYADIAAAGLMLILVSVYVFRTASKSRWLAVGWIWFLSAMAPFVLFHIHKIDLFESRYTYFPAIGIFIIVSWGGAAAISRLKRYRILLISLTGGVVIGMMITTHQVTIPFKNIDNYMIHQTNGLTPAEKAKKYTDFGLMMLSLGKVPDAISKLQQALLIDDRYPQAHNTLGLALALDGNSREAIRHYKKALTLKPDYIEAHNNLANLLADTNRIEEAINHYEEALRLDPLQFKTHHNLATAFLQKKDIPAAVSHLKKAAAINPDYRISRQLLEHILASGPNPAEFQSPASRSEDPLFSP